MRTITFADRRAVQIIIDSLERSASAPSPRGWKGGRRAGLVPHMRRWAGQLRPLLHQAPPLAATIDTAADAEVLETAWSNSLREVQGRVTID